MTFLSRKNPRAPLAAAAVAVALIGAGVIASQFVEDCEICAAATTVLLQGAVAQNCTLGVSTAAGAANLPLTTTGAQHVQVGTALQTCNKKIGYTLTITSLNCASGSAGAKVIDPASNEVLRYTAEFNNPTGGGSQASVTNLLQSACSGQVARDVSNWKAFDENSTIFVNFTGDGGLAAGTYQDTLTVTMNIK